MNRLALLIGTVALLAAPVAAHGQAIAINFGIESPPDAGGSAVGGPAGIFGTDNWNNFEGANGGNTRGGLPLIDSTGAASGAEVTWVSNGVWASTGLGEENNTAPEGNDRNLMSGYLDTAGLDGLGVTITVENLPSQFDAGFDVYVYMNGGVLGRGGDYVIGDTTLSHVDTNPFDGTFVEGLEGNYLKFPGVTGSSFTLSTIPLVGGTARAPVNGLEIRAIPEPSSLILVGCGLLGVVGMVRRRR